MLSKEKADLHLHWEKQDSRDGEPGGNDTKQRMKAAPVLLDVRVYHHA